jgi:hypothetical protein
MGATEFNPTKIAGLIQMLLGRDVAVKGESSGEPASALIAVYASPENPVAACVGCSMEFASYAAAALSLVPREVAEGDIRAGRLSELLDDNFREVMNVFGSMLSQSGSRVVLDKILPAGEAPEDVTRRLAEAAPSSFAVDVDGYGKGRISLCA